MMHYISSWRRIDYFVDLPYCALFDNDNRDLEVPIFNLHARAYSPRK